MELTVTRDREELDRLEGVIQKSIGAFYEVGRALMQIRDKELYLHKNGGEYQTFEVYCKGVWDFNSSRARQLIMATETLENIKSVTIVTPTTESQTRPLSKLGPVQQREAWKQAVETAPEGKVTAAHVYKIVKEMTELKIKEEPSKEQEEKRPNDPSDAMYFVGIAISQLERIRDDDPLRGDALEKIMNWIKQHRKGANNG
jgi:hypothetical protein